MQHESQSQETQDTVSLLRWGGNAACIVGGLVTILGFFGSVDWLFDLLSHFREQYVVFFGVLFVFAIFFKLRWVILASTVFLLINLSLLLPFYTSQPQRAGNGQKLTILMANVKKENTQYDKLLTYIKKVDPDIIVLEEINATWIEGIATLGRTYLYGVGEPREDYSGIILLSKIPLRHERVERLGKRNLPTLVTDVPVGKSAVTLIGTHPLPPFNRRSAHLRDDQLQQIAAFITTQRKPVILVGDLNSSPFSSPYRNLIEKTDMTNCATGFGYQSTWQHAPLMPPLGLSLDHCLHTAGVSVVQSTVGERIGSDHRPIVNTVVIGS